MPLQECGETWQMVTCAWPQCGGSCRPEAQTFTTTFLSLLNLHPTLLNRYLTPAASVLFPPWKLGCAFSWSGLSAVQAREAAATSASLLLLHSGTVVE